MIKYQTLKWVRRDKYVGRVSCMWSCTEEK